MHGDKKPAPPKTIQTAMSNALLDAAAQTEHRSQVRTEIFRAGRRGAGTRRVWAWWQFRYSTLAGKRLWHDLKAASTSPAG